MKFSLLIAKIFGVGQTDKKLKNNESTEITRITAINNELERLHKLADEEMEKQGYVSWEIKNTITELSAELVESN